MAVVVNLGGEGEVPGAINVNLFVEPAMVNRRFAEVLHEEWVIRRSAHDTGLADASVDMVVAHQFPIQRDEFIADSSGTTAPIGALATEVVRILKPGGIVRFACSSCDRQSLRMAFELAGLIEVVIQDGTVQGKRP